MAADSDSNPERMDNLASRPEILAALTTESGSCHRFGRTLGLDALFVGRAIRRGDHLAGWIRASVTDESVNSGIHAIERGMIAVIAVASLAAFALGALWTDLRSRRQVAAAD